MKYLIALLLIINGILGYFLFNLNNKIDRNKSITKIALYSAYCNNYRNRALEHFVRHENWDGYVLFPPVCNMQNTLETVDAIKYRGFKPKGNFILRTYDSFFTGKGHNGKNVDKMHLKNKKKIYEEIKSLLKERVK